MSVMKEWNCLEHGPFDCTHAICPEYGCESKHVTQEFRTPVGIGTQMKKRFDAGIRKSSEMYQISNFKSAKQEGDVSFAGRSDPKLGQKLLWGDECQKVMGHSFAQLTQVAQRPFLGVGGKPMVNNGMRQMATEAGITQRRIPKAGEVTAAKAEPNAKQGAQALTV